MPVKDVDNGMVWTGYNPSQWTQSKPQNSTVFYFGGHNKYNKDNIIYRKPNSKNNKIQGSGNKTSCGHVCKKK